MSRLLLLFCCLLPSWLVAAPLPIELTPYKAKYEVQYNGLKVGEMVQRLTPPEQGRRTLKTTVYTTGPLSWLQPDKLTERSTWQSGAEVSRPLSYSYHYRGRGEGARERLDFDWANNQVRSLNKGKVKVLALEPETLDKHMYQVALRRDLAMGLKNIVYSVADRDKLRQYTFQVLGEELLETEHFGALNCLKVQKGTTLIWVAKKFDYLPVKIEKEEGGLTASSLLVELKRI